MTWRGRVTVWHCRYGDWSANTGPAILTDLALNIGGSPWYNIQTTYTDATGKPVPNTVAYGGSTSVGFTYGVALTEANIFQIVTDALTSGALPLDPNAVYFVLTSPTVTVTSGFCITYCGWHNDALYNGVQVKYSFVGNPSSCPAACSWNQGTGPNGNLGADAMASVIVHELVETVTDPIVGTGYVTAAGQENGDLCAWTFG